MFSTKKYIHRSIKLNVLKYVIVRKWLFRNKECPTCRKKLVSRRSLRPDPNFDKLISQIYPNRDSMQSVHEVAYQAMMSHNNSTKAHFQSVEEGLQHQSIMRFVFIHKTNFKKGLKFVSSKIQLIWYIIYNKISLWNLNSKYYILY